jgi:thymidylate synthase (FAD)
MGMEVEILDKGYLRLVETWGSDQRIVEAARMSTDKGFLGWGELETCSRCGGKKYFVARGDSDRDEEDDPTRECPACHGQGVRIEKPGDEKLLRYLSDNRHDTPFEFAGAIVEVKAPIMVFREWHRHRTQSYNEMSARYTPLPDENYVPTVERLMRNVNGSNRQAGNVKGAEVLTETLATRYRAKLIKAYEEDQELYDIALQCGIPKELARMHLPVGRYSRMRASACLRNWLSFLTLRTAPNAQYEIRMYAEALQGILAQHFPKTMELFAGRNA